MHLVSVLKQMRTDCMHTAVRALFGTHILPNAGQKP